MDDLIIIILTLIFAAAGVFGQMRKKAAEKDAGAPEKKPEAPDTFWDFLESEGESREEITSPPEEKFPETAEKAWQGSETAEMHETPAREKTSGWTSGSSPNLKDDAAEEKKTGTTEISPGKDRFSLKKAVIYSEILNRKYT